MPPATEGKLPSLKLGVGWVRIRVISEPDVVLTFRGYAPIVRVTAKTTGLEYILYLGAKSLAEQLEPLRNSNSDRFTGLEFEIRKASMDKFSPYELRPC